MSGDALPTLDALLDQERRLTLSSLDENDAVALGLPLLQTATDRDLSVTIEVRLRERVVFRAARTGTDADNDRYIAGKARIVERFGHSSLFERLQYEVAGTAFAEATSLGLPRVRPPWRRLPADRGRHRARRCRDRVGAPAAGRPRVGRGVPRGVRREPSQLTPAGACYPAVSSASRRWASARAPRSSGSSFSGAISATLAAVVARKRGRADAAFERSPLSDDGARTDLGNGIAVHLHHEDPVQDQVDLRARHPLPDERLTGREGADPRLGIAAHDRRRELPLQGRLDGGHDGRRVGGTPRRAVPERIVEPRREVDHAGFFDERAILVVDPVAGERTGPDQFVRRRPIGVEREGQRRPRDRRPELYERLVLDRPRCRQAHPSAHRLDETDGRGTDLRVGPDIRQVHGRKPDGGRADADRRRADVPLPQVAVPDDPSILDLDERPKLVGLAEPIGLPKLLEILEVVGRGLVVVGDTHLEGDLREPSDRFRWDPGDRRDGRFDSGAGHRTVTSGARCRPWVRDHDRRGWSLEAGPVDAGSPPPARGARSIYLKASVPSSWSVIVRTPSATA